MNNTINWNDTDLCMDFHCDCGYHSHFDGTHAHFVRCGGCRQVYKLATCIYVVKTNEDCNPLEDVKEFENR